MADEYNITITDDVILTSTAEDINITATMTDDTVITTAIDDINITADISDDAVINVQFSESITAAADLTWTDYVMRWTAEPVSLAYSGGDGEVLQYTYGTTIYYRFVPSTYDATQDSFYTTYSDPTLSGLLAIRGNNI